MQQIGFGVSAGVWIYRQLFNLIMPDDTLHDMFPEIVISLALVSALLLDNSLKNGDKYIRLSWIPLYFIVVLFALVECLSNPNVINISIALLCCLAGVAACSLLLVDVEVTQESPVPDEYSCGIVRYSVFSFIVPLMHLALKKGSLSIEDVPGLVEHDKCAYVYNATAAVKSSLVLKLLIPVKSDFILQGCAQFSSSILNFATPLALGRIVAYVSSLGNGTSAADVDVFGGVPMTIDTALMILFIAPALKAVSDGQLYARGRSSPCCLHT